MISLMKSHHLKILIPIIYFLAAMALFANNIFEPKSMEAHKIVGIFITIPAFILWITARYHLGGSFTLMPKAKKLVSASLYSKIRHPVYYFSIMTFLGLATYLNNLVAWLLFSILVAIEAIRIKAEDKLLAQKFGEDYFEYKRRTWF